jgi:hypothetical protein
MKYRGKKDYSRELIETTAAAAKSKHDMLKVLGLPKAGTYGYRTLNYFLELYGVDVSHFRGRNLGALSTTIPLEDILTGNQPQYSTFKLKGRLLKVGLLKPFCSECLLTEWRDRPIPLQLDHINGKSWDHRLENLRLLCPNCHAQTDTFGGRNIQKHVKPDTAPSEYAIALDQKNRVRAEAVRVSSVDFTKNGWVSKIAPTLELSPQKVSRWMKTHMPDFYDERCFKR